MPNYNSQLQSNNTDLQTVLQTLQIKVAGSGSIETYLVNIGIDEDGGPPPVQDFPIYYYLDKNCMLQSITTSEKTTIEVVKNSIVCILHWSAMSEMEPYISNTIIRLSKGYDTTKGCGLGVYYITGNGNLLASY